MVAKTCKVTLLSSWLAQFGINGAHRQVELHYDGVKISIALYLDCERFEPAKKKQNNALFRMPFYGDDRLCSIILAVFTD